MKAIAWNVDTQYDFMSPLGKLYVKGAEQIEPNLELLTRGFRELGIQIVNSGDWHTKDSKELSSTPDFVHTFPEHCMIGTPGAEYVPATRPLNPVVVDWRQGSIDLDEILGAKEIVLYKDEFDVFSGTPYSGKVLEAINPDRVIVYGVATNVCVDFAVRGLLERGKEVYVVEDAIMGLPNIPSPVEEWKKLGAKLVKTEQITK